MRYFWFFLLALAANGAVADSLLSRVELDLTLTSVQTCRREQAVYFGRRSNASPVAEDDFLHCSLRYQGGPYPGKQLEGATAAWLKLSGDRSGAQFVGLGLQFETTDGRARIKVRGGGLSIMYQASF